MKYLLLVEANFTNKEFFRSIEPLQKIAGTKKCPFKTIVFGKTHYYIFNEKDQKFMFSGVFGDRDMCLDFAFHSSKRFKLLMKLHDTTVAVRPQTSKGPWLLLHGWTRAKFMLALPRDWTTLLVLQKTFSALLHHFCHTLKQYVSQFTRNWSCRKKTGTKKLAPFIYGIPTDKQFFFQKKDTHKNML